MYLLNRITCSFELALIFRQKWDIDSLLNYESMYALFLDNEMQPIFIHRLNEGNHAETLFDIGRTLHYAYEVHSKRIAIAHNHVSGICEPSKRDLEVTEKLSYLFNMMSIQLVDHIILTTDKYYSFSDNQLLDAG